MLKQELLADLMRMRGMRTSWEERSGSALPRWPIDLIRVATPGVQALDAAHSHFSVDEMQARDEIPNLAGVSSSVELSTRSSGISILDLES